MEIRLDCGNWYANGYIIENEVILENRDDGYIIEGNFESGYNVLNEENEDIVYSDDNFENCLTWIWNS